MGEIKNVLFMIADQWRGDTLGALGHPCVQTPNLDALAADGVLFRNHFTQASPCGPARASILTGMYMFNHRQVGNGTPLDNGLRNLALEMRAAGYEAALFGYTDNPLDPRPHALPAGAARPEEWICPGFTPVEPFLVSQKYENWKAALRAKGYRDVPDNPREVFQPAAGTRPAPGRKTSYPACRYRAEDSDTAFLADAALRYITGKGDTPWFVHYCCLRPHPPLVAPEPYDTMYDPADVPLPVRPKARGPWRPSIRCWTI